MTPYFKLGAQPLFLDFHSCKTKTAQVNKGRH